MRVSMEPRPDSHTSVSDIMMIGMPDSISSNCGVAAARKGVAVCAVVHLYAGLQLVRTCVAKQHQRSDALVARR